MALMFRILVIPDTINTEQYRQISASKAPYEVASSISCAHAATPESHACQWSGHGQTNRPTTMNSGRLPNPRAHLVVFGMPPLGTSSPQQKTRQKVTNSQARCGHPVSRFEPMPRRRRIISVSNSGKGFGTKMINRVELRAQNAKQLPIIWLPSIVEAKVHIQL